MKCYLLERNEFESFVALEDGTIKSIPSHLTKNYSPGGMLSISPNDLFQSSPVQNNNIIDKTVDFF